MHFTECQHNGETYQNFETIPGCRDEDGCLCKQCVCERGRVKIYECEEGCAFSGKLNIS